jgi:hypothetical protein
MPRDYREFSAEDDAVIHCIADGVISATEASTRLRTGYRQVMQRMHDLGLCTNAPPPRTSQAKRAKHARQYRQDAPQPPAAPRDGWVPIAHKAGKYWRELDGASITIEAARAATADGRGTMAHKRVDGGWDLLFKVVRK